MSSMRNAVARRPHKERAQPGAREKWGILEKHKDYSLRAADYNVKKRKISELSRKAAERNPDEFAFGMVRRRQGKHGQAAGGGEERLGAEAVRLLKSQDQGYLRVVAGRTRREMQKVGEEVGLGEAMRGEGVGRRVVFVDGADEEEEGVESKEKKRRVIGEALEDVDAVNTQDEMPEQQTQGDFSMQDLDMDENVALTKPLSKKGVEKAKAAIRDMQAERKRRKRLAEARANKLDALRKRQREIMAAADQLELQRAKMARSVGGVNKNGVKFKIRERRR